MKDLRENYIVNPNKKSPSFDFKFIPWIIQNKFKILKFIGIICILIVLIFPKFSGELVVNWLNNFLGTIIKQTNILP